MKAGSLTYGTTSVNRPPIPEKIIHIHGSLDENVIMGVDNKNQIANPDLRDDTQLVQTIVKPEVNNALENLNNNKVVSLIGGSNIICIFGMSIGATDSSWWKKTGEWLKADRSRQLLIFYKLDEGDKIHPENKIANLNYVKDLFIQRAGNPESIIKEQIHVSLNTDMFNLSLVKDN
jgi:hypothetical protein